MLAGTFARVGDIGPALPTGDHRDGFGIWFRLWCRATFLHPAFRLPLGVETTEKFEAIPDRSHDQTKDEEL